MKQLVCFLTCLSVFLSCSDSKNKGAVKTYKVDTDITNTLSGQVVFAGQDVHTYYDINITDD